MGNVRSYFSLTVPFWEKEFLFHRFINCYSISAVYKQAVLEVAFTIFRERWKLKHVKLYEIPEGFFFLSQLKIRTIVSIS